MPQTNPLTRKEYNKLYYMKRKTTKNVNIGTTQETQTTRETQTDSIPNKVLVKRIKARESREQIILFYYDMVKHDRAFAVWIRNIRRVNLEFFHNKGT